MRSSTSVLLKTPCEGGGGGLGKARGDRESVVSAALLMFGVSGGGD